MMTLEIPVCVHIYRNPLQIANSLYKRNNIPIKTGIALWENYTIAALNSSYGLPITFTPPLTLSIETCALRKHSQQQIKYDYTKNKYQELEKFLNSKQYLVIENRGQPLVSIILILHNRAELTFACLKSIREITDIKIEVIIVDNASLDSTGELLNRLNGMHRNILKPKF